MRSRLIEIRQPTLSIETSTQELHVLNGKKNMRMTVPISFMVEMINIAVFITVHKKFVFKKFIYWVFWRFLYFRLVF